MKKAFSAKLDSLHRYPLIELRPLADALRPGAGLRRVPGDPGQRSRKNLLPKSKTCIFE